MNILLVGSGGREHALAWKLAQAESCAQLYCAPGNPGINMCGTGVDIGAEDIPALVDFAVQKAIDLVVVGPEAPLVAGLADAMRAQGIAVFGPSKEAAQLEGSKAFMKDLCAKYGIPTAAYGRFTDIEQAKDFIRQNGAPIVVKTDGLAAGKGVIIAQTVEEAEKAAEDMLSGASFGAAGREIVIEEFLEGEEVSFFALADGKNVVPFGTAQDHKRVGDGDTGLNTGGMGAYSPAHLVDADLEEKIFARTIKPLIDGMAADGMAFCGVVFAGLMIKDGVPTVLEYNVRFGDPECQALMMRFDGDLAAVLKAAAEGRLDALPSDLPWRAGTALCVVMAAKGYPGAYQKNTVIDLGAAESDVPETKVFHAGTAYNGDGALVSVGGRVLGVTSHGRDVAQAQSRAYEAVAKIDWPEGFCRKDIGWRAVKAQKEQAA